MNAYLRAFGSNELPIPALSCVIVWCLLYATAQFLGRRGARLDTAHPQAPIVVAGPAGPVKKQSWVLISLQLALTAFVFLSGYLLGPQAFAFLAGGWLVTTVVSVPISLRRTLLNQAILLPGAATGSVVLSNSLAVKTASFELLGLAVFVTILGFCFANLALLGGGIFIAATAWGYFRKATAADSKTVTAQGPDPHD